MNSPPKHPCFEAAPSAFALAFPLGWQWQRALALFSVLLGVGLCGSVPRLDPSQGGALGGPGVWASATNVSAVAHSKPLTVWCRGLLRMSGHERLLLQPPLDR